jgi:hypothetical protein
MSVKISIQKRAIFSNISTNDGILNIGLQKRRRYGIAHSSRVKFKMHKGAQKIIYADFNMVDISPVILSKEINSYQKYFSNEYSGVDVQVNGNLIQISKKNEIVKIIFRPYLEEESKSNIGNVVEGIVATSIGCRFLHKNTSISSKQVYALIKQLSSQNLTNSNKKVSIDLKSKNLDPNILDDLNISITLPSPDLNKFLKINESDAVFKKYVNSSVNYANSAKVKRWSTMVYENNTHDKIEVYSKGSAGEKEDVGVRITNHEKKLEDVDISLSVKANDVKQFGQRGGIKYEDLSLFFTDIFGITFSTTIKTKYNQYIENKDFQSALTKLYVASSTKLNKIFLGSNQKEKYKTLDTIAKGLQKYATANIQKTEMLIVGDNAIRLDFNNIIDKIKNREYIVTYLPTGRERLPKIEFRDKNSREILFSIRSRLQIKPSGESYYRNLLERGELLTKLLKIE